MATASTITPLAENVYAINAPCEAEIDVRALLICGRDASVLLDTLLCPADLEPAREVVESAGRPLFIVNSHADWDHWWGNAAFPDAPVIAHLLTRERQRREGARTLASVRRKDPEKFAGVALRPATIAFAGRLDLDLGDLCVELHHLPGHTKDCIVAYIPERRLLFAGDAAEDPIPLLNEGWCETWAGQLLAWVDRARTVVPAHGTVSGRDLLRSNAAYLQSLQAHDGKQPPELVNASPFYRRAHRRNVKRAGA
ncbi:MAG: MBL fold metallo-hydrolase [Chloroflexota bacterium]|nr:MAG: hypothetical protein DLM70_13980 [Chloroflexota bacterium]